MTASTPRAFKTAWFSKAARKALISDTDLRDAVHDVLLGQADDLGGGVFKKRLNSNRHRVIILSKLQSDWIFEYLFAKADRANIDADELKAFKSLANAYAKLSDQQLQSLLDSKDLLELEI